MEAPAKRQPAPTSPAPIAEPKAAAGDAAEASVVSDVAPSEPAEPAPPDLHQPSDRHDAPTGSTEPAPSSAEPSPRSAEGTSRRRSRLGIAAIAVAAVLALAAIAVLARQSIIAKFPAAADWYARVGLVDTGLGAGLDIRDVTSSREDAAAGEVLLVAGAVANTAEGPRNVPAIRIGLYDGDDHELQVVVVSPEKSALGPGEQTLFTARLEEPSPDARRVKVTFEP